MLESAYLYRSIQLYHLAIGPTDVWFFLCDMLFTEINAAAAAAIDVTILLRLLPLAVYT